MSERTYSPPSDVRSPNKPKRTIIDADAGVRWFGLGELSGYRELFATLALRDIKVRYKQTLIGAGWAIVQPLLTMVVFTLIFSQIGHVSSGGKPYAVVVFVGLLPWQLVSQAVARSTLSLVSSQGLISKIYFPRVIVPIAAIGAPLFDFVIGFGVLGILMGVYGVGPGWGLAFLPGFILLAIIAACTAGIWLSLLNARFRDIGYAMPFLLQLGMYVTPVAYPLSAVPPRWRVLFELNPISQIIQGFRWGLIRDAPPSISYLLLSCVVLGVTLLLGLTFFSRFERTVADVI